MTTTSEAVTTSAPSGGVDYDSDDAPLSVLKTRLSTNGSAKKITTANKTIKKEDEDDDDVPLSELRKKTPIKSGSNSARNGTSTPPAIKKEVKKEAYAKAKGEKRKKIEDSSEDSSSSDEDVKSKIKKEKVKTIEKKETSKKVKKENASTTPKGRKGKEKEEATTWEWWKEEKGLPKGKKWRSLTHNGVAFPDPYVPHSVKLLYEGKPVDLSMEAEEAASFYAKYLETDHATSETFKKNFWNDFRELLTKEQRKFMKDFAKCDFKAIHTHLTTESAKKKEDKERKARDKEVKQKMLDHYGKAIIDGHEVKIGNWLVEPPGLFLGRGEHPKKGTIKLRVRPEDVTINIGKDAPVPKPPPGHKWKEVIHDDSVAWLASWKENVNGQPKYVKLHASSHINGQSDMKKFELSRKLKDKIGKIRKAYVKDLSSDSRVERQRACAIYFIDKLALRVGNEKGEDEADTVGCCSLRIEHIFLLGDNRVRLSFLGKDSMKYDNEFDVLQPAYEALESFIMKKSKSGKTERRDPGESLFDELTTTALNKYLKEQVDGLSAKVFRTYNASITLERELAKMPEDLKEASINEKVLFYNKCNREVAILCNHKKTVAKTFEESIGKINDKIEGFKKQKKLLKQQLAYLKGKGPKPVQSDDEATPKKEKKSDDKKRKKSKEEEDDENDFADTPKKKRQKLPEDVDKVKKAIDKAQESVTKWETMKEDREGNKEVALGTSKINYMDPRITAAWCKKVGLPIEKIFNKTLQNKFPWAMDPDEDWKY